ncbi:hypothetical protein MMC25_004615 [Agyrium rufum]|nr:hypothetical protein [Agyrium rufum]
MFLPDGETLVAILDYDVVLYDVITGTIIREFEDDQMTWQGLLTISPNGEMVASTSADDQIRLYEFDLSNDFLRNKEIILDELMGIAIAPRGEVLAHVSNTFQVIEIWNTSTRKNKCTPEITRLFTNRFVDAVAMSWDGKLIAMAYYDSIELWAIIAELPTSWMTHASSIIGKIAFSPDDETMVSVGKEGIVLLWDVKTGAVLRNWNHISGKIPRFLAFLPDDNALMVRSNHIAEILDFNRQTVLKQFMVDSLEQHFRCYEDGAVLKLNGKLVKVASASFDEDFSEIDPKNEVSMGSHWLIRGSERVLYLPADYRLSVFASYKGTVALGKPDGVLMVLKFADTDS